MPGHERITLPVNGVAKRIAINPIALDNVTVREDVIRTVRVVNGMDDPVTISKVTCSIKGVEVSLPKGNRVMPPDGEGYSAIEIRLSFSADALPAGPLEGTLTLETDARAFRKISVPIRGGVEK